MRKHLDNVVARCHPMHTPGVDAWSEWGTISGTVATPTAEQVKKAVGGK